jgi:hypothetical protein
MLNRDFSVRPCWNLTVTFTGLIVGFYDTGAGQDGMIRLAESPERQIYLVFYHGDLLTSP